MITLLEPTHDHAHLKDNMEDGAKETGLLPEPAAAKLIVMCKIEEELGDGDQTFLGHLPGEEEEVEEGRGRVRR